MKKIFTILVIGFLLISGVALTGCIDLGGDGEDEVQAELDLSEPQDHTGHISVKATVSGDQLNYTLTLTSPDGTTADEDSIKKSEMADGEHSVWLYMGESSSTPDTGEYKVELLDKNNEVMKDKTFTYDGPDIAISDVDFSWNYSPPGFDSITVNVSNSGDTGYADVSNISVTINEDTEEFGTVRYNSTLVTSSGITQFMGSPMIADFESGSHDAEIKLLNNSGSTIATFNTTVNVP